MKGSASKVCWAVPYLKYSCSSNPTDDFIIFILYNSTITFPTHYNLHSNFQCTQAFLRQPSLTSFSDNEFKLIIKVVTYLYDQSNVSIDPMKFYWSLDWCNKSQGNTVSSARLCADTEVWEETSVHSCRDDR